MVTKKQVRLSLLVLSRWRQPCLPVCSVVIPSVHWRRIIRWANHERLHPEILYFSETTHSRIDRTYRAVRDHHTEVLDNGNEVEVNEVVFNGEPIPHVPYTPSSADDLTWGYGGAGPANTSRSILEHAMEIAENPPDVDPAKVRRDFRGIDAYTEPESDESGDIITHEEVMKFLRQKEREAESEE